MPRTWRRREGLDTAGGGPARRRLARTVARIYKELKDADKLRRCWPRSCPPTRTSWTAIKLARASLDAGKPADAERYAREAIQIDVTSTDARACFWTR
jgi:hypothetical protein